MVVMLVIFMIGCTDDDDDDNDNSDNNDNNHAPGVGFIGSIPSTEVRLPWLMSKEGAKRPGETEFFRKTRFLCTIS